MGKVTILGGRAHRLLPEIVDRIGRFHRAGETCLLLVPEQYTLQAEVELIRRLDLKGFFLIQVLSPSRLTQRIFDLAGTDGRVPLDNRGKRMALSRAITAVKKDLVYYRRAAGQAGLTEKMADTIADFKRGDLTAQGLQSAAQEMGETAAGRKYHDIALCWAEYENQLAGRFVDGEDVQQEAARRLPASALFQNAHVLVYGFDTLSARFCGLLCAGAPSCADMVVTLTMDRPYARDGNLFRPALQSARSFARMLEKEGIPFQWEYLPLSPLPAAPEIAHLEENLYAYPIRPYAGPVEAIRLTAAPNPYAEVHQAAAEMIRLKEQGIPWGEMAVAAGNLPEYSSILSAVLASYSIPFYLEEKAPASSHGLIRFVLHALRAVSRGFPQNEVLGCLKSGYAPLDPEGCFRLENYALSYGIRGDNWRRPFTRGVPQEAQALEPIRQKLMEPLLALQAALRSSADACESLGAVFRLLEQTNAYEALKAEEERLLSLNMQTQAAQARQVWQFLLGTLDQMNDLWAGVRLTPAQTASLMEAGFSAGELSSLPPVPQAVVCGEIGHVMPGAVQVLFALGLSDGMMRPGEPGLIQDAELQALEQKTDASLGLCQQDRDDLMRTDLWRTLTLPTRRLYLSHAQAAQNGQSQRPAAILTTLRSRLFSQLSESGGVTGPAGTPEPLAPGPTLDALAARLSGLWDGATVDKLLPPPWQDAWACLWAEEATRGRAQSILEALAQRLEARPLDTSTALTLFGHETMSVSRLEEYAQCPYKHFVRYGLRPVPRREWALDPGEVGTFFHDALRDFTLRAAQSKDWPKVSREECDGMMDEVLRPVEDSWAAGPLGENAQTQAMGRRYLRIIRRAAWMFTQHAVGSGFAPRMAEVSFGKPGDLLPPIALQMPDGTQVLLRGVIDRVDLFEGEEGVYLRVVDYKSGKRELEPTQMWFGLQLQLLVYLLAALAVKPGAEPAGAFYFHIDDPLVKADLDVKEIAEREIAKALKLKGVVLSDAAVIRAMDPGETALGKLINSDGSVSKTADALDLEQMHRLLSHAVKTAGRLSQAMRRGAIAIAPAKIKNWSACAWCDYAGICRWDAKLPGARPRVLPPLSLTELQERLAAE